MKMNIDYPKVIKITKILTLKIMGLAIMFMDILYSFGFIHLPNPAALSKPWEILIAFVLGLTLFIVPIDFITKTLEKIISKKADTVLDETPPIN